MNSADIKSFYWDSNVVAMDTRALEYSPSVNALVEVPDLINQKFIKSGKIMTGTDASYDFFLQDDLGSPMELIGINGRSKDQYGFDEFGNNVIDARDRFGINAPTLQPFGYTGYQTDVVGGLQFAQARRYDPRVGRFVSEDNVKGDRLLTQSLNQYAYCMNQPYRLIDPTGNIVDEPNRDGTILKNQVEIVTNAYQCAGIVRSVQDLLQIWKKGFSAYKTVKTNEILFEVGDLAKEAAKVGKKLKTYKKSVAKTIKNSKAILTEAGEEALDLTMTVGKAEYFGIAIDVGMGIWDNVDTGSTVDEFISDAVVDVAISGAITAAQVGTTAGVSVLSCMAMGAATGTVVPGVGNLIGAGVGLLVGVGLTVYFDLAKDDNGNTRRDKIKDNVYHFMR